MSSNMDVVTLPYPRKKEFLPEGFKITVWSKLKPYYETLLKRPIHSTDELEQWIWDKTELDAIVGETFAWRYIQITVNSSDQSAAELYHYTVQELYPRIASIENELHKKLISCPFVAYLDSETFFTYLRNIRNSVELYHAANLPLSTEVQLRSREYGKLFSEMTIGMNGKQMTLQKANALLEETDRSCREAVYHKINTRILQDAEQLENLFDELLLKRQQIAANAGFENFRDYKFKSLGRFDYTVEDCLHFHNSIASEILPLVEDINEYRQKALKLSILRPWDLNVDTGGKEPLRPFSNADDLLEKSIACLSNLHPIFGEVLFIMKTMKHLDIESRPGKRPGAYNMPLHLSGVPFIFMNATYLQNDIRTLMHESGHAIHSYLIRNQKLNASKSLPSEIAELASMTMELLVMEHWDVFFENEADLRRAKIIQLENVLRILPWIATIDKFQHWLYTHPQHTRAERKREWMKIYVEFNPKNINREGLEQYSEYLWHKQLHIFESPFYSIEYGMAQLGAIAIWKRYRENPAKAIEQYIDALKLGYTKPISEVYATAGIAFDFSQAYVSELGSFVKAELDELLCR
ncbi:MAG: M3 family oligoendopeptidase [Saprospiraceae bacterium]|nr:M3 family oligoendopeptidase [Saprospiraceae bacterium]